jgi:hypothetical protein
LLDHQPSKDKMPRTDPNCVAFLKLTSEIRWSPDSHPDNCLIWFYNATRDHVPKARQKHLLHPIHAQICTQYLCVIWY